MPKNQIKDVILPKKEAGRKKSLLSLTREEIKRKSAASLAATDKIKPAEKPEKPKTEPVVSLPERTLEAAIETEKIPEMIFSGEDSPADPRRAFGKKKIIWATTAVATGLVLVAFLGFLATPVLSSAKIFITLRSDDVTANYELEVKLNPQGGELGFQVISIGQTEKSKEIPAMEEVEVFKKAEGPIIVYNAYGSASQRLIKNTRFEAPGGRIYRLTQSVVVPGASVKNGEMTPGSVEVAVAADSPGESYNIENTDFSIPGFKGDPRYGKFYGRSKPGVPITGGFSGKKKIASEKDIESARDELKSIIKEELMRTASSQKPADYVMYEDGMFFVFEDGEISSKENLILKDTVSVSQKGSVDIVIVNRRDLSRVAAQKSLSDWDGSEVLIPEIEKLGFKIKNKDKISLKEAGSLNFNLSGQIKIIRQVDPESLKGKILGAKKSSFQAVLGEFKNIKKAEAVIKPFWSGKFPENAEKIKILEDF